MINHIRYFVYLIVLIGFSSAKAGSYEDFFSAIERDKAQEIQSLLRRGFDPNTVNPKGYLALMLAIGAESWEAVGALIAHPATQLDVRNSKDETPLMLAALKGRLDICQQLVARGADLNKTGWTPLHYAATKGDPAIIQLMLDHYAYIDAESPNQSTPLMMAAMYGTVDAVQVLLDAGADPLLRNAQGLTAMDFANKAQKPATADLIAAAVRKSKSQGSW